MNIRQVHPLFFGEVDGIDLRQPLSPAGVAGVDAAMAKYGVLAFRGQQLDDAQQLAFSRNFGALEPAVNNVTSEQERRINRELADISNLDQENKILQRDDRRRMFNLGNLLWHSDSSFKATPAKYSLLSARVVPTKGGDTQFADMRAAWDALDGEMQRMVEGMIAHHSLIYSRAILGFTEWTEAERQQFAPVPQRLVRRHPASGRRSLFLSSHIGVIEGMPIPEARALLRDLMEHATQPCFVHSHKWQPGDLVAWDNRVTMHRARRFDELHEARDMRRTTVMDVANTLEQAA
jgi:alpha-ketoglutarate-dependent 2,4-dichlorophenoxyacetate dioxygenase